MLQQTGIQALLRFDDMVKTFVEISNALFLWIIVMCILNSVRHDHRLGLYLSYIKPFCGHIVSMSFVILFFLETSQRTC